MKRPSRRAVRRTALLIPAVCILAAAFLSGPGCSGRADRSPNIIVVVLDTVRDDVEHLNQEGQGDPMPTLTRLGEESAVFANAWSNAPWTLPSHASILTGLLPSEHGCNGWDPFLSERHRTFGERLSEAGYDPVAFFSTPWLTDSLSGMMRGFEINYVESRDERLIHGRDGSQGGTASNENIARWLEGRDGDKPFLMFVNYLEAHLPYDPSAAMRETYLPDLPRDDVVTTLWAYEYNAGLHPEESVDWERIRRLYAADASYADALLSDLVTMLEEHGLLDDSVLIVTSDHGENLGEYGLMDHQFGIFETLLDVPLVVRAPGLLPPGIREDPTMLIDIFPTVLEMARVENVPDLPHARSLLEPPSNPDRPLIAQYSGCNPSLVERMLELNPDLDAESMRAAYGSVRVGNLRLTVGSDGSNRVEDYATSPEDMIDLKTEGRAVAGALRALLPGIGRPTGEYEIDEEMREELRSLGYLP